jgi:uncharacterized protein YecT (DUF1311 family)
MKSILSAAMLALTLTKVSAASFDCAKARSKVEKAICSSNELGVLDERLNSAYKEVRSKFSADFFKTVIQRSQIDWLKSLAGACKIGTTPSRRPNSSANTPTPLFTTDQYSCLSDLYKDRIVLLQEAVVPKQGYMTFPIFGYKNCADKLSESFLETTESSFKCVTPVGKDLLVVRSQSFYQNAMGLPRCNNQAHMANRQQGLNFADIFLVSKKEELIRMVAQRLKTAQFSDIEGLIEERLERLAFENFDERNFILYGPSLIHSQCPDEIPTKPLPTSLLRPYLTPYAKAQLGL